MTKEQSKEEALQEIGKRAMESICEMVAALECDYDRLEELRELWKDDLDGDEAKMLAEYPQEHKELKELETAAGDCASREDAEQRIMDDPLSVQVRYGWISLGATDDMLKDGPMEYEILLSTGGPATRIIGEFGCHNEPKTAQLEAQDWFTRWEHYRGDDEDVLLTYVRCFCFDC